MALLEKIRVKFGLVISIIIALALLSFIIDPSTLESALNSMSSKYDVGKVAGNVPVVMAKVFESMKEATGIDLSEIINADSYDAKVNRNLNVTGLDGVNLVVNADTDKNGEKPEN